MTEPTPIPDLIEQKAYCNVLARQKGLDPVGSAWSFDDGVLVEMPLPWKRDIYTNGLPREMLDLMALWLQRYNEGHGYRHFSAFIAPDPILSRPGFRRVMHYQRPPGAFATYTQREYLVPEGDLGAVIWALYEAPDQLERFAPFRVEQPTRDLLVCTHGTIDAACAKFGYPIYAYLRRQHARDDLRVWRCSHFGGHVYAPTLIDMPSGHFWGYVEPPQAVQIVARAGEVAALRGHYRGWSGAESGFEQALERDLWQRAGWSWFDAPKHTAIVQKQHEGDNAAWADVRITAELSQWMKTGWDARVEVHQHIATPHTTGETGDYPYPQYTVGRVTETVPTADLAP